MLKRYSVFLLVMLLATSVNARTLFEQTSNEDDGPRFQRFAVDFFWDGTDGSPGNVDMNYWSNRGVQLTFVRPFKKRGPGITPAIGLSLGNHNYYNNEVFEWRFNEEGEVPEAFMIEDTADFSNKLSNTYLEIPIELQIVTGERGNRKFFSSIGVRAGWLIDSKTKYSTDDATVKLKTRENFRWYRLSGYVRAGYRNYSLFGQYTLTSMFDGSNSPDVHTFSVGLSFSMMGALDF